MERQDVQQDMGIYSAAIADHQPPRFGMGGQQCVQTFEEQGGRQTRLRDAQESFSLPNRLSLPSRAATLLCQDNCAEVAGSAALNTPYPINRW